MDRVDHPDSSGTTRADDEAPRPVTGAAGDSDETTHAGGGDTADGHSDGAGNTRPGSAGRVAVAAVAYVGARLALVAVLAGVLALVGIPLLVALLVSIIIALPLSLIAFRPLRTRLNTEVEAATVQRRARRERLRAELRGDGP